MTTRTVTYYRDKKGSLHSTIDGCAKANKEIEAQWAIEARLAEKRRTLSIERYGKIGHSLLKLGSWIGGLSLFPLVSVIGMEKVHRYPYITLFSALALLIGMTIAYYGMSRGYKWQTMDDEYDRFWEMVRRAVIRAFLWTVGTIFGLLGLVYLALKYGEDELLATLGWIAKGWRFAADHVSQAMVLLGF